MTNLCLQRMRYSPKQCQIYKQIPIILALTAWQTFASNECDTHQSNVRYINTIPMGYTCTLQHWQTFLLHPECNTAPKQCQIYKQNPHYTCIYVATPATGSNLCLGEGECRYSSWRQQQPDIWKDKSPLYLHNTAWQSGIYVLQSLCDTHLWQCHDI